MKMKNFFLSMMVASIALVSFSSCEDDDDPIIETPDFKSGAYVLNSGGWGENNSTLSYYDVDSKTLTENIFSTANDKGLGDLAQDVIVYGSKVYVTVSGSNLVYVLDKEAKILSEIQPVNANNEPLSPRSLVAHNGKVYVSLYGGYIGRVDTVSMKMDDTKVKVGPYPEQMTVTNNKLYVATSSYGEMHTSEVISVVDLNNFTGSGTEKTVGLNPTQITSDAKGNVYVICAGDYGAVKSVVKKMDSTGKVTEIANASRVALHDSKLYIVYTSYAADWSRNDAALSWYDTASGELHDESFINMKDEYKADLSNTESFAIDPLTGNFFFLTGGYSTNGDMYEFSANGEFAKKSDTGGLNPIKVCFFQFLD